MLHVFNKTKIYKSKMECKAEKDMCLNSEIKVALWIDLRIAPQAGVDLAKPIEPKSTDKTLKCQLQVCVYGFLDILKLKNFARKGQIKFWLFLFPECKRMPEIFSAESDP
jgi:hypothetical protein